MFGRQDDQSNNNHQVNQNPAPAGPEMGQIAGPPAPTVPPPLAPPFGGPAPAAAGNDNWQHPGTPIENQQSTTVSPTQPTAVPTVPDVGLGSEETNDVEAGAEDIPEDNGPAPINADSANDLMDIKQQALTQLSPLVGHLDQSPEEKFRTTMMMIQASDDHSLIRAAYEAAQSIGNEKVRAQALLDVVNEINYFTQNQPGN